MEEILGNIPGARQVFERWMSWEPDHHGWMAYIKLEQRYGETERARHIYERYVKCLPSVKAWVRYAKFELQSGDVGAARQCYERALEELSEDEHTEELFIKFADFETIVGEVDRARGIYNYAIGKLPKHECEQLHQKHVQFEKQQGDREGIEGVIANECRQKYEQLVDINPHNYDAWFDYVRLEENSGSVEQAREVYERAVTAVPPAAEKRYWQRYIYLWIRYALFEELVAKDVERTREVYRAALKLIPHPQFTFAKMWTMAAQFEIRQLRLDSARKILGLALGTCPKNKLFKSYIEMEMQLGNVDRCRTLYEKYLEWDPANGAAWLKYAELEQMLGESDRARALYELAIHRPALDMPEAVWKGYIDFEIGQGSREAGSRLYERLLERTQHVKVWLSYARFEATPLAVLAAENDNSGGGNKEETEEAKTQQQQQQDEEDGSTAADRQTKTRQLYQRAYKSLRDSQPDNKEEAVMLLEAWRDFEKSSTSTTTTKEHLIAAVETKMPKRVKRKRPIQLEDGSKPGGFEEYYDYVFPEEQAAAPNLKILEAAYKWKRQKTSGDE